MQGALGVTFRHGVISMMPHVLGALAVAVIVLVLAMTVMYGLEHPVLHSAAVAMLIVTAVQMLLGFLLFSIAFVLQTDPVIVICASMIHTAAAAVTLAATVVMVLLIWRIVGQNENDRCG
jgi:hypothetical protein